MERFVVRLLVEDLFSVMVIFNFIKTVSGAFANLFCNVVGEESDEKFDFVHAEYKHSPVEFQIRL